MLLTWVKSNNVIRKNNKLVLAFTELTSNMCPIRKLKSKLYMSFIWLKKIKRINNENDLLF